ncbi:hypothetical protein GE09DRAFT_464613 [Coniochaeta sp. 2T2.1]|nr:hypothetical protein GE09DRAFT_464613 [Coniochaeta sp. 2T2.1]
MPADVLSLSESSAAPQWTWLETPTPPPPCANIPFFRDSDFVERGEILDQVDKRCSEPAARVALVGLGGVGKSRLAIEYAHRIAAKQLTHGCSGSTPARRRTSWRASGLPTLSSCPVGIGPKRIYRSLCTAGIKF